MIKNDHGMTLSYNPQRWLKVLPHPDRDPDSAARENSVLSWHRGADQQTKCSVGSRTGISYLVQVSRMTLYSRWSWSEAGSSSSPRALSLCGASERFWSAEPERSGFGAWRCCSDLGSFRFTRSWKAGLAIGSGTL